ncbi:NmrA family NAD(P)-binding protein [Burkholderia sp. Ac-20379]|uniref:NmrA family NAD(P)-binding protein n=1 Tax=Burkholderia sp. Ac-20379 TaxID=2703900 RepID=UPI00197F30F7|nr:NAD(P)H-binding protein [Burkholderia sp. Ac-20379]MBN3722596.1 NAD(P)H-binding protein [Burkholderia sp. Ac-20379]
MYAIVGAAGKVGYAAASALRQSGVPVRAVLRNASKAARLAEIGCEVAFADIQDSEALANAIAGANAVQVVVPLTPQAEDPAADLRRSIASLSAALQHARPPRTLAISDYGAYVDADIGMPSLFREFERQLARIGGDTLIVRSAEHMQNWARTVPAAIESGRLPTLLAPLDKVVPTISAPDLGTIAAALLLRPEWQRGLAVCHAEGPRRYSANDVAAALSELSGRTIDAHAVPRGHWDEIMHRSLPASLAVLLIKATDAVNRGGLVDIEGHDGEVCRGATALIDALRPLVPRR